jgi:coatomer subunit gamma
VRDRATLYLKLLGGEATVGETEKDVNEFLFGSLDVPLVNMETSLRNYVFLGHFNVILIFLYYPCILC